MRLPRWAFRHSAEIIKLGATTGRGTQPETSLGVFSCTIEPYKKKVIDRDGNSIVTSGKGMFPVDAPVDSNCMVVFKDIKYKVLQDASIPTISGDSHIEVLLGV